MKRLRTLRTGILLTSVVVGCGGSSQTATVEDPPNVLIVMIDALRGDRLGVNGYPLPTTPTIDSLASEGINFRRAFAHSTWTKPSIATLFTSVYPGQHGLDQVAVEGREGLQAQILDSRWVTLAERFAAAGYRTGAVINQVHIHSRFGFQQGFESFDSRRGTIAPRLNRLMLDWLRGLEPEAPFFAYLHYLDVHWPYTHRIKGRGGALGPTEMSVEPPRSGRAVVHDWGAQLDLPADLEALEARYDQEVAFADWQLGKLLAGLEELGRLDDTIVVVTADHGEGFLEHGLLLHGYAPYEEVIHIPLVFRLPARLRGPVTSSEVPVGLIDVMPTLLDLAGLEREPQAQGQSLAPLIRGGSMRPRLIFAETAVASAARDERYKLLEFSDGRQELYDLETDPGEQTPLEAGCGERCERLEQRLADFMAAMATARAGLATEVAPLESEDVEEMRSLGYLD